MFHTLTMFRAGRDNIDPRRVDATVSENVGELGNIFFDTVEHPCKQMAKIVRKHLFGIDLCFNAEVFHFPPDVGPTHRLSCAGDENRACRYLLLGYIPKQFLLQITDDKNASCLAFERNGRFAFSDGFHGDELQFADADSRSADCLQDQAKAFIMLSLRCPA